MARLWPDVISSAVDPGWVPTKMGGADAPDDLALGHVTQAWLVSSDEPQAPCPAAIGTISSASIPTRRYTTRRFKRRCWRNWRAPAGVSLPQA